ncbi:MAG: phenylalanine--tRNA ligase subunit beta, partial [Bacillota bacterium]
IICGADNVAGGQKVIVALDGAVLPGDFKIEKAELRGVESNGMICSLDELGIDRKYHQEEGIHVLPEDAPVGKDALEYLHYDDAVVELDLTPNRGDLLSMQGVAYDVGAMFDREVTIPTPKIDTNKNENPVSIKTDTSACISYYGRVIDKVTLKPSPLWMQARLIAAGIRPINNIVDITNYVMIETGQPLHAFDYDKIETDAIVVRLAEEGETFTTLDGEKRTLKDDDILITNGEVPVALGGVMGGLESEVAANTESVFLESAVFDPAHIRRTSQRLALKSESSTRFERKVDPQKTRYALDRASELLVKYADASVREGVSGFDHHDLSTHRIDLPLETLNNVLGSAYETGEVAQILDRLNLAYDLEGTTFKVESPSRRPDLVTYQDLVEEIGRIGDYNRLPDTLPKTVSIGGLSPYQKFKRKVRRTLNALKLDEVVTYSLLPEEGVDRFTTFKEGHPVKVAHPISKDHAVLSLTPLNGMLDVARYNSARKQDSVHIYEMGKRYTTEGERELLGLLMKGTYQDHRWKPTPETDFYTLKGVVEALFEALDIRDVTYERFLDECYHPHQSAQVYAQKAKLGHIAKLHPSVAEDYDLKNVFMAEVDLETLYGLVPKEEETMETSTEYETVMKYPGIARDIALVIDEDLDAEKLKETIRETAGGLLSAVHVFDVYTGESIGEGKKSLALRMTFEDPKGTMEAKTIDDLVSKMLEALKAKHGATLR